MNSSIWLSRFVPRVLSPWEQGCLAVSSQSSIKWYRGILADVIVYIFANLHRALRTEGNRIAYANEANIVNKDSPIAFGSQGVSIIVVP